MRYWVQIENLWFEDCDYQQLVDNVAQNNQDTVVLTMVNEAIDPEIWVSRLDHLIELIKQQLPNVRIVVALNSWYLRYQNYFNKYNCFYVPYHLLFFYYRVILREESKYSLTWNSNNKTFLFLTGKPTKANRVRLLWKYQQQGLLDHCVWSLFYNNNSVEQSKFLIPELTKEEYQTFLEKHQRNPDNIDMIDNNVFLHYSGVPFDDQMYGQSLFQVVAETHFDTWTGEPWLTEKTYLPMINHLPFIMASETGTNEKLERMGFRTFEKYLTAYDSIQDRDQRLDAIVQNTRQWLDTIQDNEDSIRKDIEHNYQQLIKLGRQTINDLQNEMKKLGIQCRLGDFLNLKDTQKPRTWLDHYEDCKDPSWPDVLSDQDFYNLPKEIQQECVDVFQCFPPSMVDNK